MRVLYGVCGDGMGHAMRAAVAAQRLLEDGCELLVCATSVTATSYLRRQLPQARVMATVGPRLVYEDGGIATLRSLAQLTSIGLSAPLGNADAFMQAATWRPDVVLSDLDPWAAYMAARLRVPLVSLDNNQFGVRCRHRRELVDGMADVRAEAWYRAVVPELVPGARRYMVLTMHRPESVVPQTTLHLPLLRQSVLDAARATQDDGPAVAYHNASSDHAALLRAYCESGIPWRVYGVPGHVQFASGDVRALPFHADRFLDDVRRARFLCGGAGFTFLSEARYLRKPVLAVPFGMQFEQILNASYVQAAGWGWRCDAARLDAAMLEDFADYVGCGLPAAKLGAEPGHDGNLECLATLSAEVQGAGGGTTGWEVRA